VRGEPCVGLVEAARAWCEAIKVSWFLGASFLGSFFGEAKKEQNRSIEKQSLVNRKVLKQLDSNIFY